MQKLASDSALSSGSNPPSDALATLPFDADAAFAAYEHPEIAPVDDKRPQSFSAIRRLSSTAEMGENAVDVDQLSAWTEAREEYHALRSSNPQWESDEEKEIQQASQESASMSNEVLAERLSAMDEKNQDEKEAAMEVEIAENAPVDIEDSKNEKKEEVVKTELNEKDNKDSKNEKEPVMETEQEEEKDNKDSKNEKAEVMEIEQEEEKDNKDSENEKEAVMEIEQKEEEDSKDSKNEKEPVMEIEEEEKDNKDSKNEKAEVMEIEQEEEKDNKDSKNEKAEVMETESKTPKEKVEVVKVDLTQEAPEPVGDGGIKGIMIDQLEECRQQGLDLEQAIAFLRSSSVAPVVSRVEQFKMKAGQGDDGEKAAAKPKRRPRAKGKAKAKAKATPGPKAKAKAKGKAKAKSGAKKIKADQEPQDEEPEGVVVEKENNETEEKNNDQEEKAKEKEEKGGQGDGQNPQGSNERKRKKATEKDVPADGEEPKKKPCKSFARRPCPSTSPAKDRWVAMQNIYQSEVRRKVVEAGFAVSNWEDG